MKSLLLTTLITLLCFGIQVQAQIDDEGDNPIASFKNYDRNFLLIELTHSNWMDTPDGIDVEGKSRGFNFYFMNEYGLGNSNVSIATGLGLGTDNVFSNGDFVETEDSTRLLPFASEFDYKKNKLATTFLDIPVELRVKTNPGNNGKAFKVAAGFKAGVLINNHTKLKTKDDKIKLHKINHIESFRYGPTARIGYGDFSLNGFMQLNELFQSEGPQIKPFSIGITFSGF